MSPIQRRGALRIGAGLRNTIGDEQGDALDLLEMDLIQLTVPVSYTQEEDIPIRMLRHTGCGGGCFTRLLCKVARAILCYSEHDHDD